MTDTAKLGKALVQDFEAFKSQLPELQKEHKDKGLLYRNGELVKVFETVAQAVQYGEKNFPDGLYLARRCNAGELCETVSFTKGPGHEPASE